MKYTTITLKVENNIKGQTVDNTTKTAKIHDSTHAMLKRLSADSKEGLTMAQIISRSVIDYARSKDYLYTQSGLVTEGDHVVFEDNKSAVINTITDDDVVFSDGTVAMRGGREIWKIKGILHD